jgi:hemolysin activation/secretion protein
MVIGYEIEGNTLLDSADLETALRPYRGWSVTTEDIEQARAVLEKLFVDRGYLGVIVSIPEQTLEDGWVRLSVTESKLRRVRVVGNRYYTRTYILSRMPSFEPGKMLYLPHVRRDLNRVNKDPNISVELDLKPGRKFGTIDAELVVEDSFPVYAYLEVNNRSTHTTSDLRLNGLIRYDNLWQRRHSASLQYQTAPLELEEVQVLAGSYMLPAGWVDDGFLLLYGVLSDSDTGFGAGFQVIGEGMIFGLRYIAPLPSIERYYHNLNFGVDYKDFTEESFGFVEDEPVVDDTRIRYLPLSAAYSGSLADPIGSTHISASATVNFRGAWSEKSDFEEKRYNARGNFAYFTLGVERLLNLPRGMSAFIRLDGQISDQPLISNEQYVAGGMESVRGYQESESVGDNAFHWTLEWRPPDLSTVLETAGRWNLMPYLFYEGALLNREDPLPREDEEITLQGIGLGAVFDRAEHLEIRCDWALALTDTDQTEAGDSRLHMYVRYEF